MDDVCGVSEFGDCDIELCLVVTPAIEDEVVLRVFLLYLDLPNPSMSQKILGKSVNPRAQPLSWSDTLIGFYPPIWS